MAQTQYLLADITLIIVGWDSGFDEECLELSEFTDENQQIDQLFAESGVESNSTLELVTPIIQRESHSSNRPSGVEQHSPAHEGTG